MLSKPTIVAGLTALTLATGAAAQSAAQVTLIGSYDENTGVVTPGAVLLPKVPEEIFATEGPIWNLDVPNRGIAVTGKVVTIPYTVDGVEWFISGSSVLGQDGEAATGIGAFNFQSLQDIHASAPTPTPPSTFPGAIIGTDPGAVEGIMGPRRLGPTRSIYSTSENRRTDTAAINAMGLERSASAQATIEQNYFDIVSDVMANPAIANALPADFLERCGIRAGGNVYPVTAGGTLKSAGHVFVNQQTGQEYFVPDIEVVIELAENVVSGTVLGQAVGDAATGTPDAFVVNECLVIFNQDPRFGADCLGLGEAPIPRELFMDELAAAPAGSILIDTIGHLVSEHVLFVQEVLSEFIDVNAPIQITADRFRLRTGRGEIRFRGTVDKPTGHTFQIVLSATQGGAGQTYPMAIEIDPLTGGARYTFRQRGIPLGNVFWVRGQAIDNTTGLVVPSSVVDWDVTSFRE